MIAHVAEAGEDRGRVLVRLGAFVPASTAAVAAAVHVARAFQSELEGLFIEDPDVVVAPSHAFGRVLSTTGRPRSIVSQAEADQSIAHFGFASQRLLAQVARAAGVTFSARIVRDGAIAALQAACAERGPWNIVVFAEPLASSDQDGVLATAFAQVWGTTGFIACGPRAVWRNGPIVVAVEDVDRLSGMLRAAQRLAAVHGEDIWLMPTGDDEIGLDWLEGEIRLMLGAAPAVKLLARPAAVGSSPVLRAALSQCAPRMVIARFGGVLLPQHAAAGPLSDLGCPVFLVH